MRIHVSFNVQEYIGMFMYNLIQINAAYKWNINIHQISIVYTKYKSIWSIEENHFACPLHTPTVKLKSFWNQANDALCGTA